MKSNFLIMAVLSVILVACGSDPEPYHPTSSLVIVKVDESWKDGIVVSPIAVSVKSAGMNAVGASSVLMYDDSLALSNVSMFTHDCLNFAQDDLRILEVSPYIPLVNGYAMISWKWRYFISFAAPYVLAEDGRTFSYMRVNNNGRVENEEFYHIPTDYANLADLKQKWAFADGENITRPEVWYLTPKKLDKYRNKSFKSMYKKGPDMLQAFKTYQNNAEDGMAYARMCDSIENIYVATLNDMITKNELEKWSIKD